MPYGNASSHKLIMLTHLCYRCFHISWNIRSISSCKPSTTLTLPFVSSEEACLPANVSSSDVCAAISEVNVVNCQPNYKGESTQIRSACGPSQWMMRHRFICKTYLLKTCIHIHTYVLLCTFPHPEGPILRRQYHDAYKLVILSCRIFSTHKYKWTLNLSFKPR